MLNVGSRQSELFIAITVLLVPVIVLPFAVRAAITSWKNNSNDLITWADDSLPVKREFQSFIQQFGRPELVVVSWSGCKANSRELAALSGTLSGISTPSSADGEMVNAKNSAKNNAKDWFHHIATPNDVLDELASVRGFSKERLKSQLSGILLGPDGQQACLVAELGATGRAHRPEAIRKIVESAERCGIRSDQLYIGGIGAQLAWLDHDSVAGPANLFPVIGLVVTVLCVLFVRSVSIGLFVSGMGAFTGVLSAALIHWCGAQSNAVIATLPTLGGLLTISLSLHFIGYYRQACKRDIDRREALRLAFGWAMKPSLISAATTALGLGSLLLSRTLTIRQFGMFGAMITLCAAALVLVLMPAFLSLLWHYKLKSERQFSIRVWSAWIMFIQTRAKLIVATVILVAIVAGAGLTNLRTGVDVNNMFVQGHEILESDEWLESNIGPLSSLEVVLAIPKNTDEAEARKSGISTCLDPLQSLVAHLRNSDDFNVVASAVTGIPSVRNMRGVRGVSARFHLRRWFDEQRDNLKSAGMYAESDSEHLWRVSVRIPAMTDVATSQLAEKLRTELKTFEVAYDARIARVDSRASLRFLVTGLPLLFEQIETQFIEDLMVTYLGGLILITLAVFLVLRSFSDALVAMIPNVLPAVGVLGLLSILNIELDVGSVMTASIALGVAVDDTLHFVLWFQKERRSGSDTTSAVRSAIEHCGSPILQTSVICGIGLSLLGFAPFLPTVRFGTLIAGMLGVALIGDLLFLPSVLILRGRSEPN